MPPRGAGFAGSKLLCPTTTSSASSHQSSSVSGQMSTLSIRTASGHCFRPDTLFKSLSGNLVSADNLEIGSRILAADETCVTCIHKAMIQEHSMVELCTESAMLIVTASHRVVCAGSQPIVLAGNLHAGDEVMCSGGMTHRLVSVQKTTQSTRVIELAFYPDKPIESFHPPATTILSYGQTTQAPASSSTDIPIHHHRTRRGGMCRRGQAQQQWIHAQQQYSIPETHNSWI